MSCTFCIHFFCQKESSFWTSKSLKFACHLNMSLMSSKQCKLFSDAIYFEYLYSEIQHHLKQLVM